MTKAYLKTEGKLDYRECEISYYTYNMFDVPTRFLVNVNVRLQHIHNDYIKSLALNESFDKDEEAINFGIVEGKKFIDESYKQGKVKIVKTEPNLKKPDPTNQTQSKTTEPQKNKQGKRF